MRKRILSLALCFVLALSLMPTGALAADTSEWIEVEGIVGGNIKFDASTGTIVVCERTVTSADIPGVINGVPVTAIGDDAFAYCRNLTSVTIPDSVTSIGSDAFDVCISLSSVSIGSGVRSIGDGMFRTCTSLENIFVDPANSSYYSDGDGVLFNKSKTQLIQYPLGNARLSYSIPDGVTGISDRAFYDCDSLSSVSIPGSVSSISNFAFSDCNSLSSVSIGDGVTSIGDSAFSGCSSLSSVNIPGSVTSIGDSAFSGCSSLSSVNIPGSVTSIGDYAFSGCSSLSRVSIGDGVTSIGDDAFAYCRNLSSVTIPDSVTSIGDSAFYDCRSLSSVSIPDSVTSISNSVFMDCRNLTSVTIPDSVTSIGMDAFFACSNLTSVIIPGSVTSIGEFAFRGCTSLSSLTILDGVASISDSAFSNCTSLTNVIIPGSVTSISDSAFSGCTSLSSVTILDGVTSIGDYAFWSCSSLTSVRIPDGVTSIGDYAFRGCTSLSGVRIPNTVASIGDYAFYGCNSLISVSIPDGVTSIGEFAFGFCRGLTNAKIPGSVINFGSQVFRGCDSLSSVVILNGVTSIGYSMFEQCSSLTSVTIPDSVTSIGGSAFWDCSSLISVRIPDSVTSIGDYAFYDCNSLIGVTMPDSVTSIGNMAYYGCSSLTDVYYAGTKEAWNKISIGSRNEYLTNATIYFNSTGPEDVETSSRMTASTKETSITVYENTHKSSSRTDDYQKSKGATISAEGIDYKTDGHGIATIPTITSGSITVSKDGFVSRTISAEQLEISQAVYLQLASQKGPVISAVRIGNTDVLNHSYTTGLLSEQALTLTAEIDWGSSSYGGIALMQDARTVNFTGDSLTTVLKDQFNIADTIYIVATDAAGNTTKKALQFKSELEDIEFSISDVISIKLPDNIKPEFFAGQKIGVGVSSPVPVTVSAENGKVVAAIGVDLRSYSSSDNWATNSSTGNSAHVLEKKTKKFVDQFKDITKDASQSVKKLKNLQQTYKTAIKYPQGSFGFNADITVLGFAEGYYDAQGNVIWLDGGVIFNPSVSANAKLPFTMGPVPMYFEASLSGEIEAQLNILINEAVKHITPRGDIDGEIALSGGVGVGIKDVLYGSGGLEGTLKAKWRIYIKAQDYFKLSASVNAYAKAGIAFLEYKHEWKPFYNEVWYEYPPANAARSMMQAATADFYDASSYAVKDLSYLDESSRFTANQTGLRSLLRAAANPSYLTRNTLKTNIYRESTPQYVQMSDGTGLAVWLDAASSDINGIQLYYSYYDGTDWSSPAAVHSDGTLDYTPRLTVINDVPYLVWQNAAKAFSASDSLETIAPYFDISVARYEAGEGFTVDTISNPGLDMIPTICGNSSSLYVAWVNNGQNDWFGNNNENGILYSEWKEGTWSAPVTAYSGLFSIDALAADYSGKLRLAYCMDTDGDLSTTEDVHLYENGVRMTSSDSIEARPVYYNRTLYWNRGGAVVSAAEEVQEEVTGVGAYQIVEVAGEKALVYTISNGLTSTLCVSYRNNETKQWSEPVELTDGSTFIGAFAASVSQDNTLRVLYNEQSVVGDYGDDDPYGASALSMVSLAPYCDLTMGELLYSADEYDAGSNMKFFFDLTNSGSQVIHSVGVEITDENNKRLSYIVVDDEIVPGQTITASAYFKVDASATGQIVKVTAEPVGYTDVNSGDNSQTAALAFEDLSVENAAWGKKSDGDVSISANIVNRGYATRSNIVVELRRDQLDGEVVDTAKIPSLEPLSLNTVSFTLPSDTDNVYYIAIKDSGDDFVANDEDFVSVTSTESGFAVIDSISDTSVQLYLSNEKAGTCMAAIYDENGKMLTLGTKEVTAEAGEIKISYNQVKLPDHYTVKVFLTDETNAPLCEAVLQEY